MTLRDHVRASTFAEFLKLVAARVPRAAVLLDNVSYHGAATAL